MAENSPHSTKQGRSRTAYIIIAIIAVAAFIAVVALAQFTSGGTPSGDEQAQRSAPSASSADGDNAQEGDSSEGAEAAAAGAEGEWVRRDADDSAAVGDVDAPVVITEWTDPRCPFCAHFHNNILPDLQKKYVDTGKVRFEFITVAFFGEQSAAAGSAMEAAGKQGKYSEYSDALYAAAPDKGHPDLPEDKLVEFAETAGVGDIEKFRKDMNDQALIDKVNDETAKAQQYYGIQAVPFFASSDGESALRGAQPVENFEEFIDEQLEKAEAQ
ncbi:Disulfide bond formation protein D precursor [Brevibacterium ravenspurgense]|uniref:Disulfide bond formation protein D n=1 Tax=Brevibacterium ravenspurgense TaxID=479117 RepID=A0A150H870_9MICO|nr:thioredoxin domain-containing protein [Brevibacterium ravenspurgense]KXZ58292.1 Disulfide bond formation protein D precursor [Brevibacterium ravenspurgense]